jgi:hypothetical protein
MKRIWMAAALALAACGGGGGSKALDATGCWLITVKYADTALMCTGAMSIVQTPDGISGAWNCTAVAGLGQGGDVKGDLVDDVLYLSFTHASDANPYISTPWIVNLKVAGDAKSFAGEIHAPGVIYLVEGTKDAI